MRFFVILAAFLLIAFLPNVYSQFDCSIQGHCGDLTCNGDDTCINCPGDCGACPPSCPDGSCNGDENCRICPQDCNPCQQCLSLGGSSLYCQDPSCPAGYTLVGPASDCDTCCKPPNGVSCGSLGGNYCTNCPADSYPCVSLGQTFDCNPCYQKLGKIQLSAISPTGSSWSGTITIQGSWNGGPYAQVTGDVPTPVSNTAPGTYSLRWISGGPTGNAPSPSEIVGTVNVGQTTFLSFNFASPPTCSFSFSPSSISQGESTTVSWSTSGDADGIIPYSCSGDIGSGNLLSASGQNTGAPQQSQTCSIFPSNSAGTTTCTASVTVSCVANQGQPCNRNSCGGTGTVTCSGGCSAPQPTCTCGSLGGTLCNGQPCPAGYTLAGTASDCNPCCKPLCVANIGQACNRNVCGGTGTITCSGACSAPAPSVPVNFGQACNCNSCGQCGGTVQCNGACSGSTPALPAGYGQLCNCGSCGCGGTIQCNGLCSGANPTPVNYGSTCNCNTCGCGGTIQCNSACSGPAPSIPVNFGQACNCGSCGCGGTITCAGACSGANPTPVNFGQACNRNGCGGTGTITCSGTCSAPAPICPCDPLPTPPNYGQPCGSCGGTIQCDGTCSIPTPPNFGAPCGNQGTILCDGSCSNPCSPSMDNPCGICGKIICNGTCLTNCSEPACAGSIGGLVRNLDNQPISPAKVDANRDLTSVTSASTNNQGFYNMTINCGTYNLIASSANYVPKTIADFNLLPKQAANANFYLVAGTSCESDCTFVSDNIVHASCDGQNGCDFYDDRSKEVCDLSQPGWIRDYNSTHFVICGPGTPLPKIERKASVTCSSGTLVKMTRIVTYNGKPVKLVVAVCG